MSNEIRLLGDFAVSGNLSITNNVNEFPINPPARTIIVKDSMPYMYTELVNGSGFMSWMPIGVRHGNFVHSQGIASQIWTVNHNFNTTDFIYFVYDERHNLVIANIDIINPNQIQILLSTALIGTCVVFSADQASAPIINVTNELGGADITLAQLTTETTRATSAEVALSNELNLLADVAKTGSYTDLINIPNHAISAAQWSTNHTLIDGTRYLINDIVYDNGNVYKALHENESIPTSSTEYWQLIGTGSRINVDGRDILNVQFSQLKELPTTLAGYGITDALTSADVSVAISTATPTFATLVGLPTTIDGYGITDASTISATTAAVADETTRAMLVEDILTANLASEINRAIAAEALMANSTDVTDALALKADQTALNLELILKANQATTYSKVETDNRIQAIVAAAPAALDTLVEIAAQLATDETAIGALLIAIGTETTRATGVEDILTANLTDEINRAIAAEALMAKSADVITLISNTTHIGSTSIDFAVKGLTIAGDILPAISGVSNIGSPTDKFASIYTKELHLDANTLYIDGIPVIGSSANAIQISADINQGIRIATTGTGQLILDSHMSTIIQTNGANADVVVQASGQGSLARISSATQIVLTAPSINVQGTASIAGDLTVTGNMTISGTTVMVNTTNLTVKDNIITVNKGETGTGISLRYAGFEIDRGDLARERLVFDEVIGKWVAGPTSQEVTLASEPFVTAAITTATDGISKISLGLSNIDNTADINKPVSIAQGTAIALKANSADLTNEIAARNTAISNENIRATAAEALMATSANVSTALALKSDKTSVSADLALKADQSTTYSKIETDNRIQSVIGAAPAALDTLVEIAAQLATDESATSALVTAISTETTRATIAEGVLTTNLSNEVTNRIAADLLLAPQASTYTKIEVDNIISDVLAQVAIMINTAIAGGSF